MADDNKPDNVVISVAVQGDNPGDIKIYTLSRNEKGGYSQLGDPKDLTEYGGDKEKIARWNDELKQRGGAPISPKQFADFRSAEGGPRMPMPSVAPAVAADADMETKIKAAQEAEKAQAEYRRQMGAYEANYVAYKKQEAAVLKGAVASAEDPTEGKKTLDEAGQVAVMRFNNLKAHVEMDAKGDGLAQKQQANLGAQIRVENDKFVRTQYYGGDVNDPNYREKSAAKITDDKVVQKQMDTNRNMNEAMSSGATGVGMLARLGGFLKLNAKHDAEEAKLKPTPEQQQETKRQWEENQNAFNPDRKSIFLKMSGKEKDPKAAGEAFLAKYTKVEDGVLQIADLPKGMQATYSPDGRLKLSQTGGKQASVYIPMPEGATDVVFMKSGQQATFDASMQMAMDSEAAKVKAAQNTADMHRRRLESKHGKLDGEQLSDNSDRNNKIERIREMMKNNPDARTLSSLDMRDGGNPHHANNPSQPTPGKGQGAGMDPRGMS